MFCKRCGCALPSKGYICKSCGMMMSSEQIKMQKEFEKEQEHELSKYKNKNVRHENKFLGFLLIGLVLLILIILALLKVI